ncbi:hypothetical protein [Aureispira anguillae]|uniref:Leucine-rich repeat domain-containing protein n=1 Tax=Aureispira anguillae TaxID=2864201 RepID=A0A916DRD2_9BACT|nr:hypothetical protein [Aureispira anguillae]BDS11211.1 hypothetical protein AsAng_0019230 [Aureispira anguillae]
MYTPEELKNILLLFKSGSQENIELALQLAKNSNADLPSLHFEELFDYLVAIKVFPPQRDISLAEKIYQILGTESLSITIDDPQYAVIPASIFFFKNLKKLSIGAKVKVWIPHTISYFEELEELEIYLLNQKNIPLSIFEISSLVKLDLSLNLFKELPRDIWKLRNLVELNLMNCIHLEAIPNELFGLPKLEKVYLVQTRIDQISPSIAYSKIKEYTIEFDTAGKKLLADPKIGKKLLKNISKETKWGCDFMEAMKLRTFSQWKINNIPDEIKKQGLESIKQFFREKR